MAQTTIDSDAEERDKLDIPPIPNIVDSDDSDDLFHPKNPPNMTEKLGVSNKSFEDIFGDSDNSDDDLFSIILGRK